MLKTVEVGKVNLTQGFSHSQSGSLFQLIDSVSTEKAKINRPHINLSTGQSPQRGAELGVHNAFQNCWKNCMCKTKYVNRAHFVEIPSLMPLYWD